jgi:hypothetical protein
MSGDVEDFFTPQRRREHREEKTNRYSRVEASVLADFLRVLRASVVFTWLPSIPIDNPSLTV